MTGVRQLAKVAFQETLGTVGVLATGEDGVLRVRRAFSDVGRTIHEQRESRVAFYRELVRPGDLCLDVGANRGNRTEAFLRLGARVVAVEPQDDMMHYLRLKYRRHPKVTLIHAGLDETEGERKMMICDTTQGASSMSSELVGVQVVKHPELRYTRKVLVKVVTMDSIIAAHGVPNFCKIDVEGFEHHVLKGLSQALPLVSFEYTPEYIQVALDCVDRLAQLGTYEYNYSEDESMTMARPEWIDAGRMPDFVRNELVSHGGAFGDIYARRV